MHRSDYLSLFDSLHRVRRCSSAMRGLDLIKELFMVWSWMSYLLSISCSSVIDCDTFTLCMYTSDYLSLFDSLQRVLRCCSAMTELDFIKELFMVWSWMSYLFVVCIMFKCDRLLYFTLCMHRKDSKSLSDCLQRIFRCSSTMRELDLGKEWLMVCPGVTYLRSVLFKCEWFLHCICIRVTTYDLWMSYLLYIMFKCEWLWYFHSMYA
jgi:hypothetical protein